MCRDRPGNYVCDCPAQWNGRRCTEHDPSFAGGEGVDVPADPGTQGGSPFWRQCKMKTKTGHACVDVFRDKICNPECNVEAVRRMSLRFLSATEYFPVADYNSTRVGVVVVVVVKYVFAMG